MRLSELLTPNRIRIPLHARDKEGVLRELVELVVPEDGVAAEGPAAGTMGAGGGSTRAEEVLGAILERERQFPTGIGYGVAVPHGKTPALQALGVVAGTTVDPVAYETIDGEPVRIFFLLAGPESQAGAHVKAISRISRLVRREPVRARLLSARTPEEFYRVLCDAEGGGS
jgi:mannitol/fructose-specific phosphotransferase system IIA component (Ntr-type)